jgi:type I restriction enzyme S subunit
MELLCDTIDGALSVASTSEVEVAERVKVARMLRQSILRGAFSGDLVPQDPADEPASALLARIAAERAEALAAKRQARRR